MKYYLKGSWEKEYTEVTIEQYIAAEEAVGFFPTDDDGTATNFFDECGVSGEIRYEDENGDKAKDVSIGNKS